MNLNTLFTNRFVFRIDSLARKRRVRDVPEDVVLYKDVEFSLRGGLCGDHAVLMTFSASTTGFNGVFRAGSSFL